MRKSIGIMSDFKIFFLAVYHLNLERRYDAYASDGLICFTENCTCLGFIRRLNAPTGRRGGSGGGGNFNQSTVSNLSL